MSKILEDMRNEAAREAAKEAKLCTAKETAIRMIKSGKVLSEDIAYYTELPLEVIKELEKQVIQTTSAQI